MRGHLFGRGWRLSTPHEIDPRFRHADRMPGHHIPVASHLVRGVR